VIIFQDFQLFLPDFVILYVPADSRQAYKQHEVFGQFKHIEAEG
jgi:hypothetical protein